MITFIEVLNGHLLSDVPFAAQQNIQELLKRVNKVAVAWGNPMRVTSGYRTMEEHFRIYSTIAFKRGVPFDRNMVPTKSNHLYGKAVDILDKDGALYVWLHDNPQILIDAGLYCESNTAGWVHFQSVPPASGARWFKA